jgi:hypothetical protein
MVCNRSAGRESTEVFAPVQEEASHYSEEEINASIDEAIAEVRREAASRRR